MAESESPRRFRHFLPAVAGLILCALMWPALLTFDAGDWPSPHQFPQFHPPANACGPVGAWCAYYLSQYLGLGSYVLLAVGTVAAGSRIVGRDLNAWPERLLGMLLLVPCTAAAAFLIWGTLERGLPVGVGGVVGHALGAYLSMKLSHLGTLIVLGSTWLVGLVFVTNGWALRLPGWMWAGGRRVFAWLGQARVIGSGWLSLAPAPATAGRQSSVAREKSHDKQRDKEQEKKDRKKKRSRGRKRTEEELPYEEDAEAIEEYDPEAEYDEATDADAEPVDEAEADGAEGSVDDVGSTAAASGSSAKSRKGEGEDDLFGGLDESTEGASEDGAASAGVGVSGAPDAAAAPPRKIVPVRVNNLRPPPPPREAYPRKIENWELPSLELLDEPEYGYMEEQEAYVRDQAEVLERTLTEFRLDARVVEIDTGPVITMFELQLGAGIKVSQVASLANDIARALKAHAIRVVAPITGKNTVGIEVPNPRKEQVRLKELIKLTGAKASKMALPLYLGKDAGGQVLLLDLAKMPHMLIAGTTGSGKSVCLNSIIASVLMTKQPDHVKMILVDPKMVEMSQFKDVPHLMCPIVTDMSRAEKILEWAVTKMEERYELLAEARVRNIAGFNALGPEKVYERLQPGNDQERALIPTHLPYIVVIIDELADLMMTAAKEVEHHLSRLAQKSRAVGIHIIVATQRPEAKVVTGLIKSNLPCRVAFRVASRMDSRIVLDQNGGEVLMGQGDMLLLPPGTHKLTRAQGTFVHDDEMQEVLDFLSDQAQPQFHPELIRLKTPGAEGESGPRDPLFEQAVRIILESKRGSVSLLQRRLTIGYSRASRLIDQMSEAGIVGEYKGSQAREVVMTLEEWDALQQQVAADLQAGYAADEDDFELSAEDSVAAPGVVKIGPRSTASAGGGAAGSGAGSSTSSGSTGGDGQRRGDASRSNSAGSGASRSDAADDGDSVDDIPFEPDSPASGGRGGSGSATASTARSSGGSATATPAAATAPKSSAAADDDDAEDAAEDEPNDSDDVDPEDEYEEYDEYEEDDEGGEEDADDEDDDSTDNEEDGDVEYVDEDDGELEDDEYEYEYEYVEVDEDEEEEEGDSERRT